MTKHIAQVSRDLPTDLRSVIARSSSRILGDFAGLTSLIVMLVVALNLPEIL